MRDGALIFVDGGEKADTFWVISDPTIVSANDVVIPSLIPFGAVTELQTDPNGFLSIAANQLNAALDGDYFVVVNGALTMTPAFITRVTNLESGLSAAQTNISTLNTVLSQEIAARITADEAMTIALESKASASALAAESTARTAADAALQTAVDSKASQADLATEVAARIAGDQSLANGLAAEVNERTAADAALQTAVDSKASQSDLTAEITARTAADAALQTAVDSKASQADLTAETTARTDADAQLALDIAARTTALQVYSAISNFAAYSHPIKTLTGGIFSTAGIVPITTFYVPLEDTLDWGIDRYSESAAPYINVEMPNVAFTNTNAAGVNGYFAKLEFQYHEQIPDGEIEIFLSRHYRSGQTPIAFFSLPNAS